MNNQTQSDYDVVIIGAGPAGACAATRLAQAGKTVLVLEKQYFPRFSIGESLLPHCMEFLAEAGLLDAVNDAAAESGFQYKNGAAFYHKGRYTTFDFSDKSTPGPVSTFQVKREKFDQILAEQAAAQGAEFRFGHQLVDADFSQADGVRLQVLDEQQQAYQVAAKFLLDASGYGRVLPKLLDLEAPSNFPVRKAIFCHVATDLADPDFDREKILITVHPEHQDIWFWLIPFADGTASLGVVGAQERFASAATPAEELWRMVAQEPNLAKLLAGAEVRRPEQELVGFSANVTQLYGHKYALLGNAGEFLDPVFSSGVTIALKSASMAVPLVLRELSGGSVDWEVEYSKPLRLGIRAFRSFVEGWYDSRFQKVIFYEDAQPQLRQMICSILAGYAWDTSNPYVRDSERRLNVLSELCS